MRKSRLFVLATTAAMAATTLPVPAMENVLATKVRMDEYLIIGLAKVLDEVEEESAEAKETSAEETAVNAYLDLFDTEAASAYEVTGAFADEPIWNQLLAQNAAFAGFDAVGFYEVTGDTQDDLDEYALNLVLADNANLYHYSTANGELVKTPLEALFGEDQEKNISISSTTNHWIVVHLRAAAVERMDESEASESMEGQTDDAQEETSATEAETTQASVTTKTPETTAPTTKAPETTAPTTKAPETTAPTTKAPETTAPTTTAHTHTWVPVTNTVHHEATYKTVWVQDSAAWDETVVTKDAWDENVLVQDAWDEPVYQWVPVCNVCGYVYPPTATADDLDHHALVDPGDGGGWHDVQVQTGSVHHEATGHNEQVVDQAAWDETVTTGYKCSSCGATK